MAIQDNNPAQTASDNAAYLAANPNAFGAPAATLTRSPASPPAPASSPTLTPAPSSVPFPASSSSPTTLSRVQGLTDAEQASYSGAENTLLTPYTPAQQATDEQNMITQRRAQEQAQIDAINKDFEAQLATEDQAGAAREQQTNALNAARGIMGGPDAAAADTQTKDYNTQARNAILDKQAATIAGVYSQIDQAAVQAADLAHQQAVAEANNDISTLNGILQQRQQAQSQAQTGFATVAKTAPLSWSDFKAADPTRAQAFLDSTGYDDTTAAFTWNSSKALAQQVPWSAPQVQSDGSYFFYGLDPVTNKIVTQTVPGNAKGTETIKVTNDGSLLRVSSTQGVQQYLGVGAPGADATGWGPPKGTNFGQNPSYTKAVPQSGGFYDANSGKLIQANPNTGQGATLGDFFQVYAPASDGNDPVGYANDVAQQIGVDASTPLTDLAGKEANIASAIATHEGFYSGASKVAVSNNNPGNLKFNNQPGAVNSNGWAKFPTLSAGFTALTNDIHSRIEEAYGLSSGDYDIAKKLANGQLGSTALTRLMGGPSSSPSVIDRRDSLFNLASKLNPNFNEAQFEQGQKFGSNATTQKTLAAIDAVNNTFGIVSGFIDKAVNSGVPAINKVLMPGVISVGDVSTSNLGTAAKALADELSGVLGYGTASDMKLQLGIDLADPTQSPAQFKSNLAIVEQLVQNRQSGIQAQIWQGTSGGGGNTTVMTGPQGTFNVPNDQVNNFLANGYTAGQ